MTFLKQKWQHTKNWCAAISHFQVVDFTDNVEIVPLCLAERWFSEVKYPVFESFDTSLFDAAVFEY